MENLEPAPHEPIEVKKANSAEVMGRLLAGEVVGRHEVSPLTHAPEIVALVAQTHRTHTNRL